MNKITDEPGVYFQDTIPVEWINTGNPLNENVLHHQHQANEMLLTALLALDEATAEREEDESVRGREHWQRIDSKLNLLLALVSEVLAKQLGIPAGRDIRLCATQMEVSLRSGDVPPKLGELLELRTYLQATLPKALILNGKVETLDANSFVVKFVANGDAQQDLLEKFVFRQHRRAIAHARGSVKFHN
jgi:hypothetical protein